MKEEARSGEDMAKGEPASQGIDLGEHFAEAFWRQNTGLVVLLGLCPLLAVSGTVVNALGLGLATTLTLAASNLCVSLLRGLLRREIRIPAFVLIIASVVTAIELLMQAFFHDLFRVLGIFIPLIVTNCAIIGRAEAFASRNPPVAALVDGVATGLGFCLTLVLLGALRELVGRGTLLADAHLLFGDWARSWTWEVIPGHPGFLLAILPPGAFIGLGLLVAARNWLNARGATRRRAAPVASDPAAAEGASA
jgi:electron transport complex protein RnfE